MTVSLPKKGQVDQRDCDKVGIEGYNQVEGHDRKIGDADKGGFILMVGIPASP